MSKLTTTDHMKSTTLPLVPSPRNPGFTACGARLERALEQYRAQVERENEIAEAAGNAAPHPIIEDEAQRRLADRMASSDPGVYKQWLKLSPVSTAPRRDGFFDRIEAAAVGVRSRAVSSASCCLAATRRAAAAGRATVACRWPCSNATSTRTAGPKYVATCATSSAPTVCSPGPTTSRSAT